MKDDDRESIKYGKFLTDAIIRVIMKYIQEWMQTTGGKGGKVTCMAPTIVQMIRKQGVSEKACVSVVDIINNGDLTNKEYIMMPVNINNDLEKGAGTHWTILLYRKSHLRDSENTLFGRGNSLVAEPTKQPTRPSAPVRSCCT